MIQENKERTKQYSSPVIVLSHKKAGDISCSAFIKSGAGPYSSGEVWKKDQDMLPIHVALVAEIPEIPSAELSRVAAALQKQVIRDFAPAWQIQGTVDAFARLEDVPLGYWPLIIMKDIQDSGVGGFHKDKNGQPFSLIQYSNSWSLEASHECLEMLADPFGNHMIAGASPHADQGRVEFLVEVSDPCEGAHYAYTVNDVLVSDFYTPNFFDPVEAAGQRYSFTGAITKPRDVLPGGYLTWHEPVSNHWWQLTYMEDKKEFVDRGIVDRGNTSLREMVDRMTIPPERARGLASTHPQLLAANAKEEQATRARRARAQALRGHIEETLKHV